MAFTSVAGHGNLPNGNFSPIIYSKQVQLAFRKGSVVEAITNSDYFGEIANFGDTVKVIKEPEITVSLMLVVQLFHHKTLTMKSFLLSLTKQITLHLKLMILKKLIRILTFNHLHLIVQHTD